MGRDAARRACRDDIREGFLEAASDQFIGPRRMEGGVSLLAWVGESRRVVVPQTPTLSLLSSQPGAV